MIASFAIVRYIACDWPKNSGVLLDKNPGPFLVYPGQICFPQGSGNMCTFSELILHLVSHDNWEEPSLMCVIFPG